MTTPEEVTEIIARSNNSWEHDYQQGNAAAVASRYTSDGCLLPPGFDVMAGPEAIEGFWKGAMGMGIATIALDTTEVEVGGGLAVETGRFTLRGSDGAEIDNGKYLVIWHEEAGEWRMHRDIWNTSRPVG